MSLGVLKAKFVAYMLQATHASAGLLYSWKQNQ